MKFVLTLMILFFSSAANAGFSLESDSNECTRENTSSTLTVTAEGKNVTEAAILVGQNSKELEEALDFRRGRVVSIEQNGNSVTITYEIIWKPVIRIESNELNFSNEKLPDDKDLKNKVKRKNKWKKNSKKELKN